ncbi:MAG: hypothetical protein CVU61_03620 [Deltaproteobacteria bacterium HGW-Deltaproteobacteria-19]|jgi:hypothetical protein|nr:MAG: hypothetical protein CVU61_03620 [Deltaproteobacteria bacterium HGW-Deltaproteobacteria-19]
MKHEDKGSFRDKHPGVTADPEIAEALRNASEKGAISCAAATRLADFLRKDMATIGMHLDLLNIQLTRCQLGLFGYPQGRIVNAAIAAPPDIERAIRAALRDGRLPCLDSWEIARRFDVPKMEVAAACEALKIKVKPCQLGAF